MPNRDREVWRECREKVSLFVSDCVVTVVVLGCFWVVHVVADFCLKDQEEFKTLVSKAHQWLTLAVLILVPLMAIRRVLQIHYPGRFGSTSRIDDADEIEEEEEPDTAKPKGDTAKPKSDTANPEGDTPKPEVDPKPVVEIRIDRTGVKPPKGGTE